MPKVGRLFYVVRLGANVQPTPSPAGLSPSSLSESKVVQIRSVSVRYRTDYLQFYLYHFN